MKSEGEDFDVTASKSAIKGAQSDVSPDPAAGHVRWRKDPDDSRAFSEAVVRYLAIERGRLAVKQATSLIYVAGSQLLGASGSCDLHDLLDDAAVQSSKQEDAALVATRTAAAAVAQLTGARREDAVVVLLQEVAERVALCAATITSCQPILELAAELEVDPVRATLVRGLCAHLKDTAEPVAALDVYLICEGQFLLTPRMNEEGRALDTALACSGQQSPGGTT